MYLPTYWKAKDFKTWTYYIILQQRGTPPFKISKTMTGELYPLLDTTCKQGDGDLRENWKPQRQLRTARRNKFLTFRFGVIIENGCGIFLGFFFFFLRGIEFYFKIPRIPPLLSSSTVSTLVQATITSYLDYPSSVLSPCDCVKTYVRSSHFTGWRPNLQMAESSSCFPSHYEIKKPQSSPRPYKVIKGCRSSLAPELVSPWFWKAVYLSVLACWTLSTGLDMRVNDKQPL